jgi:hypothetical protein
MGEQMSRKCSVVSGEHGLKTSQLIQVNTSRYYPVLFITTNNADV